MVFLTEYGLTLTPDSIHYLQGAENMVKGYGYAVLLPGGHSVPISHWPPLYSVLLLFLDPFAANFLFMFLLVITVGFAVYKISDNRKVSLAAALFTATSPIFLKYATSLLTDLMFAYLSFLTVCLLIFYAYNPKRVFLIGAFAVSCFLPLIKYAGVFVSSLLLWYSSLYVFKHSRRYVKYLLSLLLASLPLLPLLIWLVLFVFPYGRSPRGLGFYAHDLGFVVKFVLGLGQFLVHSPRVLNPATVLVLAFALTSLLYFLYPPKELRNPPERIRTALKILSVYTATYVAVLFVARIFFDPGADLFARLLLPIFPGLILMFSGVIAYTYKHKVRGKVVGLVLISSLVLLNIFGVFTLKEIKESPFRSYNSPGYASYGLWGYVSERIPKDAVIFSNERFLLWYYTRRPALPIPERAGEFKEMLKGLKGKSFYVVWINRVKRASLPKDSLLLLLRGYEVDTVKLNGGVIFHVSTYRVSIPHR